MKLKSIICILVIVITLHSCKNNEKEETVKVEKIVKIEVPEFIIEKSDDIDSKVFEEGSIHFGFLNQRENELVIDHFPSKIVYVVDKSNGLVISQVNSFPTIDLLEKKRYLSFDLYDLIIEDNVIKQPIFHLFDRDRNIIWSYQTRQKINRKEIYQYKNRIYYLGINNQILSSILINTSPPNDSNFHKVNFEIEESFSSHGPFNVHPNPHIPYISYQEEEKDWSLKIKEKINYCRYLLSNLSQIVQLQAHPLLIYLQVVLTINVLILDRIKLNFGN
jgi:hypothetical protein